MELIDTLLGALIGALGTYIIALAERKNPYKEKLYSILWEIYNEIFPKINHFYNEVLQYRETPREKLSQEYEQERKDIIALNNEVVQLLIIKTMFLPEKVVKKIIHFSAIASSLIMDPETDRERLLSELRKSYNDAWQAARATLGIDELSEDTVKLFGSSQKL